MRIIDLTEKLGKVKCWNCHRRLFDFTEAELHIRCPNRDCKKINKFYFTSVENGHFQIPDGVVFTIPDEKT